MSLLVEKCRIVARGSDAKTHFYCSTWRAQGGHLPRVQVIHPKREIPRSLISLGKPYFEGGAKASPFFFPEPLVVLVWGLMFIWQYCRVCHQLPCIAMPLDPRARSLLDMLNRIEAPRLEEQPVAFARRNFEKLMFAYRPDAPAVASVEDKRIARREFEGGALTARLYKPLDVAAPLPVLLWLHGGGWTLGDLAGYDTFCRCLCSEAQCAVLALDYRLAPENPFPAALDDAWWALRWLQREAADMGLDATRMAIGGDSAGGNLAAVVCHLWRNERALPERKNLRFQLLVYPTTDQTSRRASHEKYAEGHFLDRTSISWFQRNYLPSEADYLDWRASPLLAKNFSDLPATLVVTAECDPLTDDAHAYAEKLAEAAVAVRYSEYAGMIHGFVTMGRILPDAARAITEMAEALSKAFR